MAGMVLLVWGNFYALGETPTAELGNVYVVMLVQIMTLVLAMAGWHFFATILLGKERAK